jgi:hypothetical protein
VIRDGHIVQDGSADRLDDRAGVFREPAVTALPA